MINLQPFAEYQPVKPTCQGHMHRAPVKLTRTLAITNAQTPNWNRTKIQKGHCLIKCRPFAPWANFMLGYAGFDFSACIRLVQIFRVVLLGYWGNVYFSSNSAWKWSFQRHRSFTLMYDVLELRLLLLSLDSQSQYQFLNGWINLNRNRHPTVRILFSSV